MEHVAREVGTTGERWEATELLCVCEILMCAACRAHTCHISTLVTPKATTATTATNHHYLPNHLLECDVHTRVNPMQVCARVVLVCDAYMHLVIECVCVFGGNTHADVSTGTLRQLSPSKIETARPPTQPVPPPRDAARTHDRRSLS